MSLYKYMTARRWKTLLKDGFIRFTQPSIFNDPFEMQPYFEYVEKESKIKKEVGTFLNNDESKQLWDTALQMHYVELPIKLRELWAFDVFKKQVEEKAKENTVTIKEMFENVINQMSNKNGQLSGDIRDKFLFFSKLVGVLSLTERYDNLLMWAHYAQNHQGFVIEFDETHEYFQQHRNVSNNLSLVRFFIKSLSTSNLSSEQWDILEKTALGLSSKNENLQDENKEDSNIGRLLKVVYSSRRPHRASFKDITSVDLLVKSEDWEYEQEWRMLQFLCDSERTIASKDGNIHLFSFPPSCIKGIIYGCRMSNSVKNPISRFLIRDERYLHVKRYKAVLDEKNFKLNIVQNEI